MSIDALKWAKDMPLGKDYSAKFVLFMLANYANEEQRCFPSVAALRSDTSMADKTIRNAIKRLEGHGLVQCERVRRNNGSLAGNRYRLVLDRTSPLLEDEHAGVGENSQTQDVVGGVCGKTAPAVPGAAGERGYQPPVSEGAPPVSEGAPPVSGTGLIDEPSIEPPIEPSTLRESAQARAQDDEGGKPDGSTSGDTTSGGGDDRVVAKLFEKFWDNWPSRLASSRPRAEKAWAELSPDDRDAAIKGIVPYHEALGRLGQTHARKASGYLDERKWEDLVGEVDAGAKYVPPVAAPYSPLWMASLFERLLTGCDGRSISFDLSRAASGHGVGLRFGKARDDELAALSQEFERAQVSSPTGQAWLRWLEGRLVALRIGHTLPRWDADFWLFVPGDAVAKAWGITLDLPSADTHPPPKPPVTKTPVTTHPTDDEARHAFDT